MTIGKKIVKDYRIPMLIVLLVAFLSFTKDMGLTRSAFLTTNNTFALLDSIPGYGIAALGFTFVMLTGQLDISFGSVMALTACVFMMMLTAGVPFLVAFLAALVLGCLCGAVTGFFIASYRLSPFIVSMTMQLIYKGIALTITNSTPVALAEPTLKAISKLRLFDVVPVTFLLFVAIALIAEFVLRRTQYGRNMFLVGGNVNAADNLGIHVRGYIWSGFIVNGFCAALAGVFMMTRMFSASGNLALDGPLNVIPMVIVGGTAMAGGKGGAICTLFGVLLMNIIYNGMTMFSIPATIQELVKGLILLIIIVSDKYMEHRHEKI